MALEPDPFEPRSRRGPVYAIRGAAATSQPLATQAALEVLQAGGSAADGAVAAAAALAVLEPCSTGLGGDAFALYFDASTKAVSALNGSGRAAESLTIERAHSAGAVASDRLAAYHAATVTVPGACAAWSDLHQRFGRLPFARVLEPAIRLAADGFPVAPITAHFWREGAHRLRSIESGENHLLPNGAPPSAGQLVRNAGLARTLQAIASGGAAAFYEGEVAALVAQAAQAHGGFLSTNDLKAHRSTWDEALSVPFAGVRVWECPPNGQGLVALLALNTLGYLDLGGMDDGLSPRRLHCLIESLRQAFADARAHLADPQFSAMPLTELLSAGYAAERALQIDFRKANLRYTPGRLAGPVLNAPSVVGDDTVQFVVVDREGNACSFVNSNFMGFGTGIVPNGLGFSLQNRGHGFSLDPAHPNSLAPRKRPYHTIIPAIATHESDGTLAAAFGVMGGLMQPQGHVQTLLAWRLDGLDPQAALDRPRFRLDDDTPASVTSLEEGVPIATAAELAKLGHPIRPVVGWDRAAFGRGQMIVRDPRSGVLCAGSDMRADGHAAGW